MTAWTSDELNKIGRAEALHTIPPQVNIELTIPRLKE